MEMIVEKAYNLYQSNTIDTPDKTIGMLSTYSFAGRVEYKNFVWWAKKQFETWKKNTTDINP